MFDEDAFGQELADIVREYVQLQTAPLLARIDALEKALAEALARPVDTGASDARAMRAEIGKGLG